MSVSQFALLQSRRFLPVFLTQALGAFNDNIFKQSVILTILYKLTIAGDRSVYVNLCAMLFILPFFLFSALAGQLGQKYAKDRIIRVIKVFEIVVVVIGAAGLLFDCLSIMLAALFALGAHSALFGPVKYSILPQHLHGSELVGGNGLVEMGTFLAILGGTICAGITMSMTHYALVVSVAMISTACLGYLASRSIPLAPAVSPEMRLNWNIFSGSWAVLKLGLGQAKLVSRSIFGISWFWFVGAIYLTQIPAYAKEYLYGDETVVTLILSVFSVGIATGSMLCELLSRGKVQIDLVRFGSKGLTVFGVLLWLGSGGFPQGQLNDWLAILNYVQGWWVLLAILGVGVFGGFYIVPLYALIQAHTLVKERSQVIASNNMLNALFMVVSAILSIVTLNIVKLQIPELFLAIALANVVQGAFLFGASPKILSYAYHLLKRK